jgi:hypothetical protein
MHGGCGGRPQEIGEQQARHFEPIGTQMAVRDVDHVADRGWDLSR